jgi:hypothetical protein
MHINNSFKQHIESTIKDKTYPIKSDIVKDLMDKADSHINELLKKKTWSGEEAGKIYFYDYIRAIKSNDKINDEHERQRKLIFEKTVKSFKNVKFDNRMYKLYSKLFEWVTLAYHRGYFYIQYLESNYIKLENIITTAYEAEIVFQETKENLSDKAKEHLKKLTIDRFIETKEDSIKTSIIPIKESLEKLMFYEVTLDVIGKLADIEEAMTFKILQTNTKLRYIDDLYKKTEDLKELLSKSSSENNIKDQKIEIIKNIIDDIHLKKLIPSEEKLINGTCEDRMYQQGFNLAIEINQEKNRYVKN